MAEAKQGLACEDAFVKHPTSEARGILYFFCMVDCSQYKWSRLLWWRKEWLDRRVQTIYPWVEGDSLMSSGPKSLTKDRLGVKKTGPKSLITEWPCVSNTVPKSETTDWPSLKNSEPKSTSTKGRLENPWQQSSFVWWMQAANPWLQNDGWGNPGAEMSLRKEERKNRGVGNEYTSEDDIRFKDIKQRG